MNERLKELREALGLSQRAFARALDLTGAAISRIEANERPLTSKVMRSICREFDVNQNWLEHGTGDMFAEKSDHLARAIDILLKNESEASKALLIAFSKLDESAWKVIEDLLDTIEVQRKNRAPKERGDDSNVDDIFALDSEQASKSIVDTLEQLDGEQKSVL